MQTFSIYHDFVIRAAIDKVYDAIVQPKHLTNWWPLKCSGRPINGDMYNFNFTEAYDWYGRVIEAQKNKSFHVKMTKSDEDWNSTTFGFDLLQEGSLVKVRFQHTGWPECNDEYRKSSYCWAILLQGLKNYLEKDVVVPFQNRE